MIRRAAMSLAALALIVAVAVGLALISPLRKPPTDAIELPRSTRLTCIPAGSALIGGSGPVTVTGLDGAQRTVSAPVSEPLSGPAGLSADERISGGVLVEAPQRAHAACAVPSTAGMVLVPDPAAVELVLVNTDSTEAAVDLTLLGPDGEVAAVGARGIALAPGVSRRVALSVLAPAGPVGVAFTTSLGRVALLATGVEGRPTQFAPPTTIATEHLLAGAPTGATSTRLLISNPHEDRVDVTLEGMGPAGPYVPAVAESLSVPAMTTVAVDLTQPLSGEATAVRVTAPEAVGASLVTGAGGAKASVVAAEAGTDLAALVPGAGQLQLSNPGRSESVTVDVTLTPVGGVADSRQVEVPPGYTVSVPIPAGDPVVVSVSATGDVLAAAASVADAGTVLVPVGPAADAPVQTLPAEQLPGLR
ncbi:DUF5719 family protein [Tessaracoccus sp. Z1128]